MIFNKYVEYQTHLCLRSWVANLQLFFGNKRGAKIWIKITFFGNARIHCLFPPSLITSFKQNHSASFFAHVLSTRSSCIITVFVTGRPFVKPKWRKSLLHRHELFLTIPCCQVKKGKSIFDLCACKPFLFKMHLTRSTSKWGWLFRSCRRNAFVLQNDFTSKLEPRDWREKNKVRVTICIALGASERKV